MKAIGRNLIIQKVEQGTTQTEGGLLLAELHKDDISYIKASVIDVGDEIEVLKKNDIIFYDKHAGHKIEIEKDIYHVIKIQDVVVVL